MTLAKLIEYVDELGRISAKLGWDVDNVQVRVDVEDGVTSKFKCEHRVGEETTTLTIMVV